MSVPRSRVIHMFDQLRFAEPVSVEASPWFGLLAADDSSVDTDGSLSYRELFERIEAWGPSIETLTVLMAFEDHEIAGFGDYERVQFLALMDSHCGWMESRKLRAIVAVSDAAVAAAAEQAASPGWDPLGLLAQDVPPDASEVGAALRLSPGTADRRVVTAKAVTTRLPATQAALEGGQISLAHAAAAAEATEGLTYAECGRVEGRVFPRANRQTILEFKRSLARAVAWVHPQRFAERHRDAAAKRSVTRYDLPDGMAALHLVLPAADVQAAWLALDVRARSDKAGKSAGLGLDARRADAFSGIMMAALADPAQPAAHGRPVSVGVVVDLPTLLGLADNPAELVGHGPIPGEVARLLAEGATWRRLVTDPVTGHLLDYGRTTYTPPRALSDFVLARNARCVFPGCSLPAHANQIDHAVAWSAGGDTSADNLRPLSRRHHDDKTLRGWAYVINADGSVTWTSPTGHTYTVPPDPLLE